MSKIKSNHHVSDPISLQFTDPEDIGEAVDLILEKLNMEIRGEEWVGADGYKHRQLILQERIREDLDPQIQETYSRGFKEGCEVTTHMTENNVK